MDDKRFDDLIRGKLHEFQVQDYDPSALEALHRQLASVRPSPWYSRYRTELLTSGVIILSTLVILLSQWFLFRQDADSSQLILRQQKQIENLSQALDELRKHTPDTVYLQGADAHAPSTVVLLLDRIRQLERTLAALTSTSPDSRGTQENPSVRADLTRAIFYPYAARPVVVQMQAGPVTNAYGDPPADTAQRHTFAFSAKTQRALEKHYQKGIGIRIGPLVEVSKGFYQAGNGTFDLSGGLATDLIVSPSFSIETGVKFSHRFYEIPDKALTSDIVLPDINPESGPLVLADVDSWMFEIPVNLKYRAPVSPSTHWLAGLGYSSLLMTRQVFEYEYALANNPGMRVNESHAREGTKLYPGMINLSLGFSNQRRNGKIIETSLFYHYGLGSRGHENLRVNFLGLRATYWFRVR